MSKKAGTKIVKFECKLEAPYFDVMETKTTLDFSEPSLYHMR